MQSEPHAEAHPKLLVVDDNEENLAVKTRLLERLDAEILTARSGNEALTLLLRHEVALVLLNAKMPGMDGYETATLMRSNQAFSAIPIIFITVAGEEQQYVFQGFETVAVDYLFEPFDPDILISKVRVFVDLYTQKRTLQNALAENKSINEQLLQEIQVREKMENELQRHSAKQEQTCNEGTVQPRQYIEIVEPETSERPYNEGALQQTIEELKKESHRLETSNQELKNATFELIQSERLSALGELTGSVAHVLNQPLNGIKIIAQSLLRDIRKDRLDVEELDQELAEVVFQVDRMSEIIDHMRIYSRRSDGSEREMIDVNTVIDGANKLLYQQLTNHNIKVLKHLESDLPPVLADPIHLEQVVMNLIANARKAVDALDNGHKTIELKTYQDKGRHVVFEISDNGVGIPPENLDLIFEPFCTIEEEGREMGLGLAIANKIIKEHSGNIEVVSTPGEETTFRVFLPIIEETGHLE